LDELKFDYYHQNQQNISMLILRKALSIFLLGICFCCHGQNDNWKKIRIDENLTLSFPGEINRWDSLVLIKGKKALLEDYFYENESASIVLRVSVPQEEVKIDNREDLELGLDGMAKGFNETARAQGFQCSISDTTLDGRPAKKAYLRSDDQSTTGFIYMFIADTKFYILSGYDQTGTETRPEDLTAVLKSVQLSNKIEQTKPKAKSTAYRIGYALGQLILPAVLVGGIIFWISKRKKKKQSSG
jgi:hypothetical protein